MKFSFNSTLRKSFEVESYIFFNIFDMFVYLFF